MKPVMALLKRTAPLLPGRPRRTLGEAVEAASRIGHLAEPAPLALRLAAFPRATVLVHPDFPSSYQAFGKLCTRNGYRMIADPQAPHDLSIRFQYHIRPYARPTSRPMVNGACEDVSKSRVAAVFRQVFGYELAVDPLTHRGPMVEKPDGNHTFDGRVVDGPLPPDEAREDRVYERFVDTDESGQASDLRTPVYGGEIPLVFRKTRPSSEGLKDVRAAEICRTDEIFSADEIDRLKRFAAGMRLDFGELDVLRDRRDGRIYVVDVNNTPAGPPKQMRDAEIARALDLLSPAFIRMMDAVRAAS